MPTPTSIYREAILIFGFILPGVITAAIIGGLLYAKSDLEGQMTSKRKLFAAFEKNRKEILQIESRLVRQRPLANRWSALLEEEASSALTEKISDLRSKLPPNEFQQTSFNRSAGLGTFSTSAAYPSTQLQLSFRANYRSMQRAFLEFESRLPQLQLQTLKIERTSSEETLTFQATYTAWEK